MKMRFPNLHVRLCFSESRPELAAKNGYEAARCGHSYRHAESAAAPALSPQRAGLAEEISIAGKISALARQSRRAPLSLRGSLRRRCTVIIGALIGATMTPSPAHRRRSIAASPSADATGHLQVCQEEAIADADAVNTAVRK